MFQKLRKKIRDTHKWTSCDLLDCIRRLCSISAVKASHKVSHYWSHNIKFLQSVCIYQPHVSYSVQINSARCPAATALQVRLNPEHREPENQHICGDALSQRLFTGTVLAGSDSMREALKWLQCTMQQQHANLAEKCMASSKGTRSPDHTLGKRAVLSWFWPSVYISSVVL